MPLTIGSTRRELLTAIIQQSLGTPVPPDLSEHELLLLMAPSQRAIAYLTSNVTLVATGGTWQTVTSWTDILTTPDQPFAAGEMPLPSATECWKAKISGTIVCGSGNSAALEVGWAPVNNGVEDLPNRLTDIVDAGRFLNFSSTQILTGAALRTWKFRLVFSSLAAGTPYLQKGATVEITRLKL